MNDIKLSLNIATLRVLTEEEASYVGGGGILGDVPTPTPRCKGDSTYDDTVLETNNTCVTCWGCKPVDV